MATGTSRDPKSVASPGSRSHSNELFERAQNILVGGVNSPVRAFRAVGGTPLIIDRAQGSRVWDADGREYLDYVCSWGALILGHADPDVVSAVADQACRGTSYGMTSPLEIDLGERIAGAVPSMDRIRFVSSGTEATMSAIRVARGFTKRDLILKFEGGYHGHADSFLVEAGSGLATLGISSSPGVPAALAQLTLNAPYNDVAAVERIFAEHRGKIAAVIVEPVAANMGVAPPASGFLESLRKITQRDGALLIFDEVITGFRLVYGGAQKMFGIRPDMTVLGKIIGGGLPVAAYGGRREIMELIAPLGPVYQAGTLSGNPLAMRAGLATLPKLEVPGFYEGLNGKAERLSQGLRAALQESGVPGQVNTAGSLLTLFFTGGPVRDYAAAKKSDTARFAAFFREMLGRGILLPPSQFEALFVSAAHTDDDIERTVSAARESFQAIRSAN
ncbi:MAG TPA: glutamate-1-semialdehyde 2,1-aminomutase [Candidatus Polarisedimenticolia bacterium]|nr:glutamate-1-semialdehyde 2,1-aminomutase [Candidatus Polarisedimenticolia bacterium]